LSLRAADRRRGNNRRRSSGYQVEKDLLDATTEGSRVTSARHTTSLCIVILIRVLIDIVSAEARVACGN
jgi:hypothetical protein